MLWRVLKQSRDGLKEIAQREPGQTLVELVLLQRCEIEYLTSFGNLVQQLNERFPKEWQDLEFQNALAEVNRIASVVLPRWPPRSPKQKQEDTRRRQFANDRVGLIEFQFGGGLELVFRTDPLLAPLRSHFPTLGPTCLDEVFAGGTVAMETLEDLFWMHRNRFGQLPIIKKGRERLYNYHAVLLIMDKLLYEKRPMHQPAGRRLRIWLSKPDVRKRVLVGLEMRVGSFPMPEKIRTQFLALLHRHLQDSAKK